MKKLNDKENINEFSLEDNGKISQEKSLELEKQTKDYFNYLDYQISEKNISEKKFLKNK